MAFDFKFPDVGEGIHEGKIVEWLISEGDSVEEDQTIMKVETDKAVVDLPSPRTGTALKLHAEEGETIFVGNVILTIGEVGEKVEAPSPVETPSVEIAAESPAEAPPAAVPPAPVQTPASSPARRPLATPHTRALARKLGVDLAGIKGSGKGGRITDEDVERAVSSPAPTASVSKPAAMPAPPAGDRVSTKEGEVERIKLVHLRKVIANAMSSSVHTSAHVTHVDEADVTDLLALYKDLKDQLADEEIKLTLMPFFIKTAVAVLKKHPYFNASYDEENGEVLLKHFYNIGMAVDTPEGLIVPVVKNADKKSIVELSLEVQELALKARERKLSLDEIQGGTFTLTNIGPIGGLFATPIIHQPELAIVGTHTAKERPVVMDGEIKIRKIMYTSVSFDHRIIDGAQAARFMSDFVKILSNPYLLMVKL